MLLLNVSCSSHYKGILNKIVNDFYQAVFPEKNFLENIHKKGVFWGTYICMYILP